jgi:hypothetical protein
VTPHIHLSTLAVNRHDALRNVSFQVPSLESLTSVTTRGSVATEFSKNAPYLYLVNRVRKCKKNNFKYYSEEGQV